MPILNKGTDFGTTDQVTSAKLDSLVDGADFTNTSGTAINSSGTTGTCVSDGGLEVTDPGGQLQIKSNGVTTAKILDANVTKAKIENVANMKALGNTSGSAAAPQEVTINDTDNMSDASATTLATSESIKAYVDSNSSSGGYSLYRTVDARNGQSIRRDWVNWQELIDPGGLGAFGTGSSGLDQPHIYQFASTGTYLIEVTAFIESNDTTDGDHYYPRIGTNDGSLFTQFTYTTNTGGLGGLVPIMNLPFEDGSTSGGLATSSQLSFVLRVGSTSDTTLEVYTQDTSGADLALWEGAGTLKITKLSSSLI